VEYKYRGLQLMGRISFAGPTYVARSPNISLERSVNFYVENNPEGSKGPDSLIGTPGTDLWATVGTGVIRGKHVFNGVMFVVSGNKLYSVTTAGTATELGTLSTSTGNVSMQDNGVGTYGNQLIVVDGTDGYIYNVSAAAFSIISTSGGFPSNPTMVEFLDGYFVVISSGLRSYNVSELYDGTTWLAQASKEVLGTPSQISSVITLGNQLCFMKSDSTEFSYNAATATSVGSPFSRVAGSIRDFGIAAPFSISRGDSGVFFLGNTRAGESSSLSGVMLTDGSVARIISTTAINYQIQRLSTVSDAFGYCYTDEGHTFYVLTFPTENWTIVYDTLTQQWHERSLYISGDPFTVNRHVGNTYAYFNGKHLIGDYRANGKIYHMDSDYYDDDGVNLVAFRTTKYAQDDEELRNVFFSQLQIDMETGVGAGVVAEPQAVLSWSDDGGRSWASDRVGIMGRTGEYTARVIWRRLGRSRARVFRLTISDPVKRVITGAYVKAGL
jgi:hypothetical protein